MCGITGFLIKEGDAGPGNLKRTVERMALALTRRGPDDSGEWVDEECGVALGFRRLSIIDLSPNGHQPMVSASGRYVIVFNGEIYNYIEIREELRSRGVKFYTNSDTEVVAQAFIQWGKKCLDKFNGMWALAIYNIEKNEFFLFYE